MGARLMSRLIDADLLMRKCEKWLKPKAPDEDEMVSLADIAVSMLMEIEEQPTAYDVQKVLDELERKIEFAGKMMVEKPSDKLDEIANNAAEDFILAYSEAIEIVKRGGRDEE